MQNIIPLPEANCNEFLQSQTFHQLSPQIAPPCQEILLHMFHSHSSLVIGHFLCYSLSSTLAIKVANGSQMAIQQKRANHLFLFDFKVYLYIPNHPFNLLSASRLTSTVNY